MRSLLRKMLAAICLELLPKGNRVFFIHNQNGHVQDPGNIVESFRSEKGYMRRVPAVPPIFEDCLAGQLVWGGGDIIHRVK